MKAPGFDQYHASPRRYRAQRGQHPSDILYDASTQDPGALTGFLPSLGAKIGYMWNRESIQGGTRTTAGRQLHSTKQDVTKSVQSPASEEEESNSRNIPISTVSR